MTNQKHKHQKYQNKTDDSYDNHGKMKKAIALMKTVTKIIVRIIK